MSNRDSIIDKIRKLRRMTEASGASETEASMAAAQVAKLIAIYNVDESELRLRADAIGMVDDFYSMPGSASHFHTLVCKAIARFTHTKLRWRTVVEDTFDLGVPEPWTYVKFYGYPLDVEASISLSAICQVAIVIESERWEKRTAMPKGRGAQKERSAMKQSFIFGMCERFRERIDAFGASPEAGGSGTALMIVKDELVFKHYADYLEQKGIGLRVSSISSIDLHSSAYEAGKAAASTIDLGRNERLSA